MFSATHLSVTVVTSLPVSISPLTFLPFITMSTVGHRQDHQDLLSSHLRISILAHPALSLSPCLMEGDVSMLPVIATNVATEGW